MEFLLIIGLVGLALVTLRHMNSQPSLSDFLEIIRVPDVARNRTS